MHRPSKRQCGCGAVMSQVAEQCLACRRRKVHATCGFCGAGFEHKPGRPRAACSPACASGLRGRASGFAQSRKVDLVCQQCGRIKSVSPTYADRKYCGRRCKAVAMSGPGSPFWKGGVTSAHQAFYSGAEWRSKCAEVWRRERGICQRCKERCAAGEVHHIRPWAACPEHRLTGSNLALLCVGCHKWVHSKRNAARLFLL